MMVKEIEAKGPNGTYRGKISVDFGLDVMYDLINPLEGKVYEYCAIDVSVPDVGFQQEEHIAIMTEEALKEGISRAEALLVKILEYKANDVELRDLKGKIMVEYLNENGYCLKQI